MTDVSPMAKVNKYPAQLAHPLPHLSLSLHGVHLVAVARKTRPEGVHLRSMYNALILWRTLSDHVTGCWVIEAKWFRSYGLQGGAPL